MMTISVLFDAIFGRFIDLQTIDDFCFIRSYSWIWYANARNLNSIESYNLLLSLYDWRPDWPSVRPFVAHGTQNSYIDWICDSKKMALVKLIKASVMNHHRTATMKFTHQPMSFERQSKWKCQIKKKYIWLEFNDMNKCTTYQFNVSMPWVELKYVTRNWIK